MDGTHLFGTSFDVDDQNPATGGFDDPMNPPTAEHNNVLEHDDHSVEHYALDQADPSATGEESRGRAPKTEEEMRECKHCDFKAEDWPAFAKHVFKAHHIKKVAEAYNIKLTKDPPSSFACDICSITCCGHLSFNAHMLGAKHRKALQQKAAENERSAGGGRMKNSQFGNIQNKKPYDKPQKPAKGKSIGAQVFANYPQPLIGLEYVTEVQVAGQNPRYECSLCDAKFEHDLKFPHLVGQKHRMNVLKIKRPDFVKELHPTSKKRSELTAALLKESIDLELAEGRKEVKIRVEKPPPGLQPPRGRGGSRGGGRGERRNTGHPKRGSWSSRETSFSRGRGSNMGSYITPPSGPSGLSYGSSSYGSFGGGGGGIGYDSFSYNMPYNASYDNPNYGRSYQQSTSGFGQGYPESNPSYFDSGYSAPPPQIEPPRNFDVPSVPSKQAISPGLATALGDLTKLVKNDEDASVALQVSNALTQALLQYRMDDIKQDYN
ncbi:keratin, type I cytoskeletal 9-like [Paramuricea clavata]|uniref:Keratin, type I cytoskeletal 9-like n=1 Tax=Paramuricea clavata TaxID=317549 RepID=A0A7D9H9N6_PARCT|nr:keratin, type I cytoskeletal 9-like [Paramuricea clavata]